MGGNLSSLQWPDESLDVISGPDRTNSMILGIVWLCAIYGLAMVWTAVTLMRRWAGPHGERGVNIFGFLAAMLISTAWPAVLVYLLVNK